MFDCYIALWNLPTKSDYVRFFLIEGINWNLLRYSWRQVTSCVNYTMKASCFKDCNTEQRHTCYRSNITQSELWALWSPLRWTGSFCTLLGNYWHYGLLHDGQEVCVPLSVTTLPSFGMNRYFLRDQYCLEKDFYSCWPDWCSLFSMAFNQIYADGIFRTRRL